MFQIGFLAGPMGMVNAQRTVRLASPSARSMPQLNYIRTLAEFISQPQYSRVVAMFSPINEPNILLCAPTLALARPDACSRRCAARDLLRRGLSVASRYRRR